MGVSLAFSSSKAPHGSFVYHLCFMLECLHGLRKYEHLPGKEREAVERAFFHYDADLSGCLGRSLGFRVFLGYGIPYSYVSYVKGIPFSS